MAGCFSTFSRVRYALLGVLALGLSPCYSQAQDKYTFSVVPQNPRLVIHKNWSPLLNRVSDATGVKFRLVHYDNITKFGTALRKGEPDFAYANPYQAVRAHRQQHYEPLLRDGTTQLKGILVVRKDASQKSLKDLQGSRLAFPSPNAFAASLYLRALLDRHHVKFTPVYVRTHGNVYRNVLRRTVDGGGGVYRTLNSEIPVVKDQLRVLFETPGSAPHPIVVNRRVPAKVKEAVLSAIIGLGESVEGRRLLEQVKIPGPVRADYRRDYKALEGLGLEKYVDTKE